MKFEYNYKCKKEEGKPPKPERLNAMKKSVYESILSLISTNDTPEAEEVRAEITAELNKSKAKADANRATYEELHDKVMSALKSAGKPVTATELATETGAARGKIIYGLTKMWSDEIVKDNSGKVTTYALA